MSKPANSYGQILKSSSIIGGAQGINYLIAMVRTKLVAVLLGPSGVGLIGLYVSATNLIGTIAGLGFDSSGVREVAEADGSGDAERVARTVKTLRRACWVTGILGWILCAALSYPLSIFMFGSGERAWAIAILGATLFFGLISGGQSALLQGTRRIGDIARLNVFGAIAGTIVAVGLFAWLGEKGIVPALITTAAINLGFSWWLARRVQMVCIPQTWVETLGNSKRLIHIGVAFMYGALLAAIVGLVIRSLIVRKLGFDANGIYQAAWGISGMFAGFILNAMGTDFYPRLTAVARDNEHVNRLVNEQTEIGILLALPGLLATLAFAPWIMHLFYSAKFLPSAELLPWFVIGVLGQVILFPIGFIPRAKGAVRWIYLGQTEGNILHLVLCLVLIPLYGILGTGYAYVIHMVVHGMVVFGIASHLSRFVWNQHARKLLFSTAFLVIAGCASRNIPNAPLSFGTGAVLVTIGCIKSLRGIASRLGPNHRIVAMACKAPFGSLVCGLDVPPESQI